MKKDLEKEQKQRRERAKSRREQADKALKELTLETQKRMQEYAAEVLKLKDDLKAA